jgi:hypothetical protein
LRPAGRSGQIRSVGASLRFALAPDGKRFAVFPMPEATARPAHVTFLLNFFDELAGKVPTGNCAPGGDKDEAWCQRCPGESSC